MQQYKLPHEWLEAESHQVAGDCEAALDVHLAEGGFAGPAAGRSGRALGHSVGSLVDGWGAWSWIIAGS